LTQIMSRARRDTYKAGMPALRQFAAAPHRPLFLGGFIALLAVMAWWTAWLTAPLPATLLPAWLHGWLFLYGPFPFFIFGFLYTVFPRWFGTAPVTPAVFIVTTLALVAGLLASLAGASLGARAWLIAGAALTGRGLAFGFLQLARIAFAAQARGLHERVLLLALAAGVAGAAAWGVALITNSARASLLMRDIGLWLFLGLTLFGVLHRMLPFFTQGGLPARIGVVVPRPMWSLPVAAAAFAAQALAANLGLMHWAWPAQLALAFIAFHHLALWRWREALTVPLLAMLQLALAWLGLAMLAYAASSLGALTGITLVSERAALHAYTIGFIVNLLVAMASRVMLGHSGRPVVATRLMRMAMWLVPAAALARMLAEFMPVAASTLNRASALLLLATLLAWALPLLPWCWRPRADGEPG
jgi:uncharacterized protein involved in response to NO